MRRRQISESGLGSPRLDSAMLVFRKTLEKAVGSRCPSPFKMFIDELRLG